MELSRRALFRLAAALSVPVTLGERSDAHASHRTQHKPAARDFDPSDFDPSDFD